MILKDLYCQNLLPVKVFCDNNSTIKIVVNPIFHERTKHLNIDLHFVREIIISCVIEIVKIDSADQATNLLTKGLDTQQHNFFVLNCNLLTYSIIRLRESVKNMFSSGNIT